MAKQKFTAPEPMTAERLREWRESRKLSFNQMATLTGVHRHSISRWEAGEGEPPAWLGFVLGAVAYGLPPYR